MYVCLCVYAHIHLCDLDLVEVFLDATSHTDTVSEIIYSYTYVHILYKAIFNEF